MRTAKTLTNGWTGLAVLIALAPAALRADLLYFRRGGQVQLPAETQRDGTVRLALAGTPCDFSPGAFRKRVPGFWPEHDWPRRLEHARAGTGQDRFAAAWWALANGLTPEAEALFVSADPAGPSQSALIRLRAAIERLGQPVPDPANLDVIQAALGGSFEVASSPHVLLLHQHSRSEAAERLELLERVVRSFYLLFAAHGLELPLPRTRLVSAWFADRADYLAFLDAEGAGAFRNTQGYFHPTLGVVVTYDTRSGGAQRAVYTRAAHPTKPQQTPPQPPLRKGGSPRGLPALSFSPPCEGGVGGVCLMAPKPQQDESERLRCQLLQELERRSEELGTAAHELVHLLVARSGLAPHHDDFPLWLHEGLATQFEVVRGGRWAGFGHAHDLRLPDWRQIDPPPRLVPLLRDTGFGHGYRNGSYAAAWALVYYLRSEHTAQFLTFLDLLRIPDPDLRPRADRTVALFRAAFGDDLGALEADWHRVLSNLQTPLEAEAYPPP